MLQDWWSQLDLNCAMRSRRAGVGKYTQKAKTGMATACIRAINP